MYRKILVIHRDPDWRRITSERLESFGYAVVSVESGRKGLRKFDYDEEGFDLIFYDLAEESMDSEEFSGEIRDREYWDMIIAFDEEQKQEGLEEKGFNLGLVESDVLVDEFEDRVKELVRI